MLTYQEALQFIHGRPRLHKKPTLKRMRLLMQRLGNPQENQSFVHVAGTNGKGSTVAFLSHLFSTAGMSVGTYTSPFIKKFNERIRIDHEMVSDEAIIQLVAKIKPVVEQMDVERSEGPTEFEIVTAMMFLYFKHHPVDVVIVEVGIGGKYDSTNVLVPDLSIITTIGYDHMKILGGTLPEIAAQKAGIITNDHPVIVGKLSDSALTVIEQVAQKHHAPILEWQRDFHVTADPVHGWHESFDYQDSGINLKAVRTNLMGAFQIQNASLAIKAYVQYMQIHHLPINNVQIMRGIAQSQWAGRFEKVNDDPLVIIDGAHNEPAFKELRKNIKKYFYNHEIYIILAILSDKQYQLMVQTLADLANVHLILTEFVGPHNRKVANFAELAISLHAKNQVQYVEQWQKALPMVVNKMSADDVLIITGSLYFISEVRKLFEI